MRPIPGTITDPRVTAALDAEASASQPFDPRDDLVGKTVSGFTVTGIPLWSREYVEVSLPDGTPSARRVELVRKALAAQS